ncbi:tail fiber protein [Yersinia phage phiR2-01]|uniref:Phage tail fibers n=1 Tax=Yersinia phage phiR2-01 TaxID=1206557 RepID=I7J3U9_9CAUD|nr:tail fiber protein [Yersinia phage phiR2-01]CCI88553.1 phage tail fibers [Yersinia phage phiR2-01]
MTIKTKIIVQQLLNIDETTTTAGKYPKYTVILGNSISSITAGELTAAIESASSSAAAAHNSEVAAAESAANAKDSENQAAIHADASEASATQSAASAAEAAGYVDTVKGSADDAAASALEAKGYKDAASASATESANQASLSEQAKQAALAAQTAAETAATNSANSAAASASSATDSANSATEAAAKVVEAGEKVTEAAGYATNAADSAAAAKVSETNAAGSATDAAGEVVNAATEADRAKTEADRAEAAMATKLDKEDIASFVKVYKTKAEADADVANRVTDEKVLVWSQTESKYGWYKVTTAAEVNSLTLVESEQKLLSVNNIKADDAGNVQVTLPGGNPSLWLGEVTWFAYDKDSGIGYPGVLPADGREVLRADYPDVWEAIEAGLIPSVTEVEWQAGANLYFSTGDGSTTFRLPDMMQGQAFRAADKNEENAGNIHSQIPYVVTVNGISPDEATGNVEIDTSLQGTVEIEQGGTGATTKENARIALEVYSTTEVDTALTGKANTDNVYSKSEVDTALVEKADLDSVYSKSEVDTALSQAKTQADTDYVSKTENLADLSDIEVARDNLDVYSKAEIDAKPSGGGYIGQSWWHDMRSKMPDGCVASDGQEVDQVGPFADLYADVAAGNRPTCTEAEWQADPMKRGCYVLNSSTGKMRLPDRNGVQPGSIPAPPLIGDGGSKAAGSMYKGALPNVKGETNNTVDGNGYGFVLANAKQTPPFGIGPTNLLGLSGNSSVTTARALTIDLSKSSDVFKDGVTSVQPAGAVGCFVIRYAGRAQNAGSLDAMTLSARMESINADLLAKSVTTNARIGYSLISVGTPYPAVNSRTVFPNPFGNNVPVMCVCELFHATLQKWVTTPWLYGNTGNTFGATAAYSEGEGIALTIGANGYLSAKSGASQSGLSGDYFTASPMRIHVWKVTA